MTATTPCGCVGVGQAVELGGGHLGQRHAGAGQRGLERLPAGSTFEGRGDGGAADRDTGGDASSTSRTPSASASPRRSRPRRRWRSRIVVSRERATEVLTE